MRQTKTASITKRSIGALINVLLLVFATAVLVLIIKFTEAGVLTPSASPASTMQTTGDIYNVLAGTYNSSGISANQNGSAVQILKCIITNLDGGSC